MHVLHRVLASADSIGGSLLLNSRPSALLPPIQLYRRILRAHRKLPVKHRVLGDSYVKAEFRSHREVENPVHIVGFLSEWQMYVQHIEGDSWKGSKFDKAKLDKMSDEQIVQLYELMQAIKQDSEENNSPGTISKQ